MYYLEKVYYADATWLFPGTCSSFSGTHNVYPVINTLYH